MEDRKRKITIFKRFVICYRKNEPNDTSNVRIMQGVLKNISKFYIILLVIGGSHQPH